MCEKWTSKDAERVEVERDVISTTMCAGWPAVSSIGAFAEHAALVGVDVDERLAVDEQPPDAGDVEAEAVGRRSWGPSSVPSQRTDFACGTGQRVLAELAGAEVDRRDRCGRRADRR